MAAQPPPSRGTLVEREEVTTSVARLLDGLRAGHGGALFIVGDAGLGKSTILAEARAAAGVEISAGIGLGDAVEATLPFGPVSEAIAQLGGPRATSGSTGTTSAAEARAARLYATQRWIEADSGPRVLLLDDLHWVDADSLALLSFVCRQIGDAAVGVIGTLRLWPPDAADVAAGLAERGLAELERLEPLSDAASAALLEVAVGRPVDADVARGSLGLCAGNPLLLEQVAAAIRRGERPGAGAAPVPAGPRLMLSRFSGMDAASLHYAQLASVMGTQFRPTGVAAAGRLDEAGALDSLEALCRSGLMRPCGPGRTTFTHPLFAQALYDDIPEPVRERLHAACFRALVEQGVPATEAAEHAVRARLTGDRTAVRVLIEAGRAAASAGATRQAVAHLRAALDLSDGESRPVATMALARAQLGNGELAPAIALLNPIADAAEVDVATRLDACRLLAEALSLTGAHELSDLRSQQAVGLAAAMAPATAVEVLLDQAYTAYRWGGPARALPLAVRARELAAGQEPSLRRRAESRWGYVAIMAGDAGGIEAVESTGRAGASEPLDGRWIQSGSAAPLVAYGISLRCLERWNEAERVFRQLLAATDHGGSATAGAYAAALLAAMLAPLGRIDEALALAARSLAMGEPLPPTEALACSVNAECLLLRDRLDEAEQWCERGTRVATERLEWPSLLRLHLVAGRLLLAQERTAAAARTFDELEELTDRLGIAEPCLVPWAREAVRAHLAGGSRAAALRVTDWLETRSRHVPCRWPASAARACRAAIATHDGGWETAEAGYAAALQRLDGSELVVDRIRMLIDAGSLVRRSGHPVRARPQLAEAVAAAEQIGATGLARAAADELAAAGGRRRRPSDRGRLTAQQARVARLAASGLTTPEIALHISVSRKTVETHLQHVYERLRIASRRDLMRAPWLIEPDQEPQPDGASVP